MENMKPGEWRQLLTLLLSQRLEINALESALKTAGILTAAQIKEVRTQAMNTAKAWSTDSDTLALLKVHSSPDATMLVPLKPEEF